MEYRMRITIMFNYVYETYTYSQNQTHKTLQKS